MSKPKQLHPILQSETIIKFEKMVHGDIVAGVSTPYGSSTCFGCRPGYVYGKRSADAEPEAEADAYYGYPYGYGYRHFGYGYGYPYRYGHYYGKRSAEAEPEADALYAYAAPYAYGYAPYGYGYRYGLAGVAGHPTGTSFVARSPQGLRGKRSAEPFYGYGLVPVTTSTHGYGPVSGYGIGQAHPGLASSFQSVTRFH